MKWVFNLPKPVLALIGAIVVVATFALLIMVGNWLYAFVAAAYSTGWAEFSVFCYVAFIALFVFIWSVLEDTL